MVFHPPPQRSAERSFLGPLGWQQLKRDAGLVASSSKVQVYTTQFKCLAWICLRLIDYFKKVLEGPTKMKNQTSVLDDFGRFGTAFECLLSFCFGKPKQVKNAPMEDL